MTANRIPLVALAAALGIVLAGSAGCGDDDRARDASAPTVQGADSATDKLAQVQARGTLILFTDPAYPPQSSAVKRAERPATTKGGRERAHCRGDHRL
jgi:hypothetical protein